MISVELGNQISLFIDKSKLLGVSGEHNLLDVDLEKLFLLGFTLRVKQDIVDCSLKTAYDGFGAIFIHVRWLIVHDDLLLKFQISFAKDQNLAFTSNIHFSRRTNSWENFNSLVLAVNCCDQSQVVRREEVNLTRVLPNELILMALKFVTPRQNEFWANIFNVSGLKVVKFLRVVRTVIDS